MRLESLSVSTNLRQKALLIVRLGRHHFASLQIAAIQTQLDQAEQAIGRLEAEREQADNHAAAQEQALREAVAARAAQTERMAAAEAKAGELAARVEDLKGELERAHARQMAEREAVTAARAEAQAAAVEAARLQGELTALKKPRSSA